MSAKKRESQPKEEPFAWKPGTGGILKGTKFAKPPCPVGSQGFHQYVKLEETRGCRVWRCRLCDRTLGINRESGNVRERSCA
jgi:hypothetical protein